MELHTLKLIAFGVWFAGTLTIFFIAITGKLDVTSFNNVPWSQVLKSKQHQVFIVTLIAFAMMWVLAYNEGLQYRAGL